MVLAPGKGEWGSTAVSEGKKSSGGMKFLKMKFGVRNTFCINLVDGHNLILPNKIAQREEFCPASHIGQLT